MLKCAASKDNFGHADATKHYLFGREIILCDLCVKTLKTEMQVHGPIVGYKNWLTLNNLIGGTEVYLISKEDRN